MAEVQASAGASVKDSMLLAVSILALLGGVVAFYWYDELPLVLRVALVVGGLAVGMGLMWFSWYGREFWQFALASRTELRKVVWPDREDTVRTTVVIFGFVVVMSLFFWTLDWILTWLTRLVTGQPG